MEDFESNFNLNEDRNESYINISPASLLPVEILEFIMSMLSFHRDLPNVRLVCSLWNDVATSVMERCRAKFYSALEKGKTTWSHLNRSTTSSGLTIAGRYLHSACYYDRAMYVFGGCTASSTCFNDIWKFDLGTNEWSRPLVYGDYPPPKAWSSLVPYKDRLILFGGCTYSSHGVMQEHSKFYNHVHFFDLSNKHWALKTTSKLPSGRAGHQASIVGDKMVIIAGNWTLRNKRNDVWVLDLVKLNWEEMNIIGPKPQCRTSHSQVVLDDEHILIMGGYGDRREPFFDVWLLTMSDDGGGSWGELKVLNPENAPSRMWGHTACMVDNKMMMLGKITRSCVRPLKKQKCTSCLRQQELQTQRLKSQTVIRSRESIIRINVFQARNKERQNSRNNRDKRLQMLSEYEEKFRRKGDGSHGRRPTERIPEEPHPDYNSSDEDANGHQKNPLIEICTCSSEESNDRQRNIHLLETAAALTDTCVSWLAVNKSKRFVNGEVVFYSLVNCISEVVMFGGMEDSLSGEDTLASRRSEVNNAISFLSFRKRMF